MLKNSQRKFAGGSSGGGSSPHQASASEEQEAEGRLTVGLQGGAAQVGRGSLRGAAAPLSFASEAVPVPSQGIGSRFEFLLGNFPGLGQSRC